MQRFRAALPSGSPKAGWDSRLSHVQQVSHPTGTRPIHTTRCSSVTHRVGVLHSVHFNERNFNSENQDSVPLWEHFKVCLDDTVARSLSCDHRWCEISIQVKFIWSDLSFKRRRAVSMKHA